MNYSTLLSVFSIKLMFIRVYILDMIVNFVFIATPLIIC